MVSLVDRYADDETLFDWLPQQNQTNQLYLLSSAKTITGLVLKIFQYSITETALTMRRFCGITLGYF